MIKILITAAVGVSLLVGLAFLFVWLGEHLERKTKERKGKKFYFIDKYLSEMETASERQMEKKRLERIAALNQAASNARLDKMDAAHLSGGNAMQ